jgi:hypothetical protein
LTFSRGEQIYRGADPEAGRGKQKHVTTEEQEGVRG